MLISIVKRTQLYFIFSFMAMIAGGTLLLKLPFMYREAGSLDWADALFTATSAVCVTGLTTVNLCDFTFAGQSAVLLLIQLGGIGIMTLTASIMVLIGHKMSFGDTLLFANLSERFTLRGTESLNRMVLNYTLFVEGLIMVLVFPGFMLQGHSVWRSIYLSLFHSVSAFCNAGMSPFPDNLVSCPPWVKFVLAAAIILGGLGIYVIYDCQMAFRTRRMLKAQTKLTLVSTAFLVVGGTVAIWMLQRFGANPMGWLDSFCMSVTARTAGFNYVPMAVLSSGSITVLIILMQIGGAPGSTAGGMKVTTVALAALAIYNTFKGNSKVLVAKREIPVENILKAFSLIVTYIFLAVFGGIALQSLTPSTMQWAFFEAVSALGTVGLALDNPEALTLGAKLFIVLYMFIGRVGLFTIFLFLLGREHKSRLEHPEERIIVG